MASVNNINTLQNNMFKKKTAFKTFLRWFAVTVILVSILKFTATDALDESESSTSETSTTDEETTNADDEIELNADDTNFETEEKDFYSFNTTDITGNPISLEQYRGKVSLIVNVASECGFTDDHYKGLVRLQEFYRKEDFTVLAFPCNQFGAQEPASNYEIEKFARSTYRVDFPMFAKVNVLNDNVPDEWKYLIEQTGEPPNWNFWKYLVDRNGYLLNAWGPWVSVAEIYEDIKQAVEDNESDTVVTESKSTLDPHGGEL
ncbi:glutathione peroxidase 7-like [Pecten maximus]|uniref:glutathione peroxidase 7-like n=1 Tax=Pecten maximus TaxID=6579 RepID=UPI001458328E|nr:glutathione peroxidase 7-like [Pecten maximus]